MLAIYRFALVLLFALTACPSARPPPVRPGQGPGSPGGPGPSTPAPPGVTWQRVETAADMPAAPPPGSYQLHLIDVGTGLAILVRGADFALLYDAGTNDREERPSRVTAYLAAALGGVREADCADGVEPAAGGTGRLDHVVLSHPHFDHASALEAVFHCFAVTNFWDTGAVNDTVFYRELLAGIAARPISYRTAAPPSGSVEVKGARIALPRWQQFAEGDVVELGAGARFTVLHADGKARRDLNNASIVLALDLGATRVLLVGDAEAGGRKDPSYPADDVEGYLLDHQRAALRAAILQVGHHGSKTSSRSAFLEAVAPRLALLSSGPKRYGKVTLPDVEVLEALRAVGATLLRTDERDADCPVRGRIGGDSGPGGCDSWVVVIEGAAP